MAETSQPKSNQPQPEFEIIRTQRVEESSPLGPIVIGVVLIVAIVGGSYFLLQGGDGTSGDAAETPVEGSPAPDASPDAPSEPVPQYVWDRINFLEDEGHLEKALTEAEEALEEYPGSTEMKARVEYYRQELGYVQETIAPDEIDDELAAARQLLSDGDYDGALTRIDAVLDVNEDHAEAWYLRGQAAGLGGDQLQALEDLEEARRLGYDGAKVDALIRRFQ